MPGDDDDRSLFERATTEPGIERAAYDRAVSRHVEHRLEQLEDTCQQLQREVYGLHGQDGIRTDIKLLRMDHEEQRRETKTAISELDESLKRIKAVVDNLSKRQIPRWLMVLFLSVFAGCAIITAVTTAYTLAR